MITGNPLICEHCGGQIIVRSIKKVVNHSTPRNFVHFSENYTPTHLKTTTEDQFVCEECGKVPE